jgi:ABC-2 type transport system permease protein
MGALYKKELRSFFHTPIGYAFVGFLLLLTGIFTTAVNLVNLNPQFEYVLSNISFIFLLITPMLTMRVFSEERHAKTDQLLYSLPIGTGKIVLAKYLAMLTVFGLTVLAMSLLPVLLSFYGKVNFFSAYSCLFGFFCLGAALTAIGMLISSLTESQILSAVISFVILLVIYLMGSLSSLVPSDALTSFIAFSVAILLFALVVYLMTKNVIVTAAAAVLLMAVNVVLYFTGPALFEGAFPQTLRAISLFDRFYNFLNGVFDLTAIVYFVSVAALFVFLTVQTVEKRRWS